MMRFPDQWRDNGVAGRESVAGDRHGCFLIPPSMVHKRKVALRCIASSGTDWERAIRLGVVAEDCVPWEHVSVSPQPGMAERCPTWEEMCFVRDVFWEPEDCVVQYHPPHSEYVNDSRYCLHLWRPVGIELPRPPSIAIGHRNRGR